MWQFLENIIATLRLNGLAQWPANKRPCVGFFNGAFPPLAGNYHCNTERNGFHAHYGNSKKKPSPSKSQLKAVAVQEKSDEMFEVR